MFHLALLIIGAVACLFALFAAFLLALWLLGALLAVLTAPLRWAVLAAKQRRPSKRP